MAYFIELKTFTDDRGQLTPIDRELPFDIKRLYYINKITDHANRGGHLHYHAVEAIFCIQGSFSVMINNGREKKEYNISTPFQCLIVEPMDWHMIHNFSHDAVLMGVSSTHYDKADYSYEEPQIDA